MAAPSATTLRLREIEDEISTIDAKVEELSLRKRELVSKRQQSGAQPLEPPQPGSAKGSGTGQAACSGSSAGTGSGESFFSNQYDQVDHLPILLKEPSSRWLPPVFHHVGVQPQDPSRQLHRDQGPQL